MNFFKLSGAGNDFIVLAEVDLQPSPEQIVAWCRRGLSIGADGLFILHRVADGVRMEYFNADGGTAELCLNGTRCAAQLAVHLGWFDQRLVVHTAVGPIPATRLSQDRVRLDLPGPERAATAATVAASGTDWTGYSVTVGNPHFVVFRDPHEVETAFKTVAPLLRRHDEFGAAGANVHFARVERAHQFSIRSFERGVEAETLACGTGALATVAAGLEGGQLQFPVEAQTEGGLTLEIDRSNAPDCFWSLTGDARLVYCGQLQ